MNSNTDKDNTFSSSEDDSISLNDFVEIFKWYRVFIFSIAGILATISLIYSFFITPMYIAQVKVMPSAQIMGGSSSGSALSGLGGLAGLAGISLGGNNEFEKYLAIFKSRKFIEDFIEEENLLPKLFDEYWDKDLQEWKDGRNRTVRSGHGQYRKHLQIRQTEGMWVISFQASDPRIATELANSSIKRINNYSREKTIKETNVSIEYLNQQIESTSLNESKDFLYSIIEEQTKKIMLANSREEYVFEVIDPAIINESIYYPIRDNFFIIGLIIGLLFSYGLAIFTEMFSTYFPFLKRLDFFKRS
tara:strand:+ start:176 stop:1087 length:912 start_codon:yes stop_codon:yes gene_type:complete